GQERPLPPMMIEGLKSTLNNDFIAIALNYDELSPQYLGDENVEGSSYNKVIVNVGDTEITFLLNSETAYPQIMRFSKFVPQQGKTVTVENHYSDWKISGGVAYPYTQVTYI